MPTSTMTDIRTSSAIATRTEVANLVHVRPDRITDWSRSLDGRPPLVHTIRTGGRFTVPLVGIAETASISALRAAGMSMAEARRAGDFIRREYADEYAMASPRLFTDGTHAFFEDQYGLARVDDRQGAMREVIADHLRPLIIGPDGMVEAFRVEEFTASDVTIDPRYNAGRMSFTRNRVPVFAVAGALQAGEKPDDVASDYGLTRDEAADVARLLSWLDTVT